MDCCCCVDFRGLGDCSVDAATALFIEHFVEVRAAKTTQAALSRHDALTLMVKTCKIPTGPVTAIEIDSVQTPDPYPSAILETEEAQLILDG